jgi:serine/threonine protein kinase
MEREADALLRLDTAADPRHRAYAPRLVETFRHRDNTATERRVNVLGRLHGFHTLADVRAAHPDGLDPRDAAWIWRRLLVALGWAHRAGLVHGAVLPEHILVHPAQHGLVLVDWCYSTEPGGTIPALVDRHRGLYPPEVLNHEPASPATDIHLASHCMRQLMGERAPSPLRAFIRGCTLPAEARRPHDAWRLLAELDEALERLYGPRTFRQFTMPGAT